MKKRLIKIIYLTLLMLIFMSCGGEPETDIEDVEIKEAPTLISPEDGVRVGSSELIAFSWNAVENAESYKLTYKAIGGSGVSKEVELTSSETSLTVKLVDESQGFAVGDDISWEVSAIGVTNTLTSVIRYLSIKDDVPPVIENLTIQQPYYEDPNNPSGPPMFGSGQTATFTVSISDNLELASQENGGYIVDILNSAGTSTGILTNLSSTDGTFTGTFQLPSGDSKLSKDDLYSIKVTAKDEEGNAAEPQTTNFKIDNVGPTITGLDFSGTIVTDDNDVPTFSSGSTVTYTIQSIVDNIKVAETDGVQAEIINSSGIVETNVTPVINASSSSNYSGSFLLPVDTSKYSRSRAGILDKNQVYSLKVTATDEDANTSSEVLNFRIDFIAPVINFTENASYAKKSGTDTKIDVDANYPDIIMAIKGSDVTYAFTVTDNLLLATTDPVTIGIYDGNTQIDSDTNLIQNFSPSGSNGSYSGTFSIPSGSTLIPGKPYYIRVNAKDNDDNISVEDKIFKLDAIPPEINDLKVTSPTTQIDDIPIFKAADSVTVSADLDENISVGNIASSSGEVLQADGTQVGTFTFGNGDTGDGIKTGQFVIADLNGGTGLENGKTYNIKITAEDDQGNAGSNSLLFKIDNTTPSEVIVASYDNVETSITNFSETRYINNKFVLQGTATDDIAIGEVYVIVERDEGTTPAPTTPPDDTSNITENAWFQIGDDLYKKFSATGTEEWSSGIDVSDKGDGSYFIWLRAIDVVGNELNNSATVNNSPVGFNINGEIPRLVIVDVNAPEFDIIYDAEKYQNRNTEETAWTLADILLPTSDKNYPPYGSQIDSINHYDHTKDIVKYLDWDDTTSDYKPDYNNVNSVLSLIDLDICEPGSGSKKITVEIGIDNVFEAPFDIYTGGDTCVIGTSYNADIGYKNDTNHGGTGRLSKDKDGNSLDTTHKGTYRINLLDFPKSTGNMIADGQHEISLRLTDEAGNTNEKKRSFYTRLLNRPVIAEPYNNRSDGDGLTWFRWYHPTNNPDGTEDYSISNTDNDSEWVIGNESFITRYFIDFSPQIANADPSVFEMKMVSRAIDGSFVDANSQAFNYSRKSDNNHYRLETNTLNMISDSEIGTGEWYWRIRGVIEDNNNNELYQISSDYLPIKADAADHVNVNGKIHKLQIGSIFAPAITSPAGGKYFGTNEAIEITWNDPVEPSTVTTDRDGFQLQIRTIDINNGNHGDWISILGNGNGNGEIDGGPDEGDDPDSGDGPDFVDINSHTVDVNEAPIKNRYGRYQFRIRTVEDGNTSTGSEGDENQTEVINEVSGWSYGDFIYTPDTINLTDSPGHMAVFDGGLPITVQDIAISDSNKTLVASLGQNDINNRLWILNQNGEIQNSIELKIESDAIVPKVIVPVTESVTTTLINPITGEFEEATNDYEIVYFIGNVAGETKIFRLNQKNQIEEFIADFTNINLNNTYMDDIVGMGYYEGELYVYIYREGDTEKIIKINLAIKDYVEVADIQELKDFDEMPAIDVPISFGVNSIGEFIILDQKEGTESTLYTITKLRNDAEYVEEYDLNKLLTQPEGTEDPIALAIAGITDFEIYRREIVLVASIVEYDGSDITPPTLASLEIIGDQLTITYSEILNENSLPINSSFTVNVDSSNVEVNNIAISEDKVTLTLGESVTQGAIVKASYAAGTSGSNPIQDAFGNNAANFTGETVTNQTEASEGRGREIDFTKATGKIFTLTSIGILKKPYNGYDASDENYSVNKIGVGSDYIIARQKEKNATNEKLYKIRKDNSLREENWGYDGYIIGGGTWKDYTPIIPGDIGIRYRDDNQEIEDSADSYLYVVDKATQQIIKLNGTQMRSQAFVKLGSITISPKIDNSRGIYVVDEGDNAIYHLKENFSPVIDGSFDETGKLDEAVFFSQTQVDTDGDPNTPPEIQVSGTRLSEPKGSYLEITKDSTGIIKEYLYVADYSNNRIVSLLITQNGTQVTRAFADVSHADMTKPIDVAVYGGNSVMYVLTETNRVFLFRRQNSTYVYRYQWTVESGVTAIDTDQYGCVYVTTEHGVYKWGFDEWAYWTNGSTYKQKPISNLRSDGLIFGSDMQGSDDLSFNNPSAIIVGLNQWSDWDESAQQGNTYNGIMMYVSDLINRRIKVLKE